MELKESELSLRYQTFCDPRLNFEQSLGEYMRANYHPGAELIGPASRRCVSDIESLQARTKWTWALGKGTRCSTTRAERAKVINRFEGRVIMDIGVWRLVSIGLVVLNQSQ